LYTGCAKRSLLTTHSAAPDSASLSLHDALPIFAEGVAQLAALDEKLEAIHQARVAVFAARQGRGLGRIVQDEHGDALLAARVARSEEHTSELQSRENLDCRLLRELKILAAEAAR